jgi:hypothetical protein
VGQAVAGHVLDVLAAGPDDRAIGEDDLEPENGIPGLAVLDTAQSAGVRAEVAADRAGLVARGIRGVEEALGRDAALRVAR